MQRGGVTGIVRAMRPGREREPLDAAVVAAAAGAILSSSDWPSSDVPRDASRDASSDVAAGDAASRVSSGWMVPPRSDWCVRTRESDPLATVAVVSKGI